MKDLIDDKTLEILIKAFAPLVFGALLIFFGKLFGFIFTEIFTTRKILLLVATFLVSLFINPSLAGFITLAVFLLLIGITLLSYYLGPKSGTDIIFAGFYDVSGPNGFLARTGASKKLDIQFSRIFDNIVKQSSVQKVLSISLLPFKPPALIHSWCDQERFERLVNRYKTKNLGVIWGTVNKDGQLQHLEASLNTEVYHLGKTAQEIIDTSIEVVNSTDLKTESKINFIARELASLWSSSFCHLIATSGKEQLSLQIIQESQQAFGKAIDSIEKQNTLQSAILSDFAKQQLLPIFYSEEARNRVLQKQWEEAINHLIETLLLNPFFPFSSISEFTEFYLAHYQVEASLQSPLKDEVIESKIVEKAEKAMLGSLPHFQLLIDWLYLFGTEIKSLRHKIDKWFSKLKEAFPDNPYIYLYWADAIKIPARLGLTPHLEPGPDGHLPLKIMDTAIAKCEEAYKLAPKLHVISAKITAMSLMTALYFPRHHKQHKQRIRNMKKYKEGTTLYFANSESFYPKDSNAYDWKKFGFDNFEELQKNFAESDKSREDE